MKTATKIKDLTGFTGQASLYRLSEPLSGYGESDKWEYVIVSATTVLGAETYIFPATPDGVVASWGELDGSLKGTLCHEDALREAGYVVVTDA